MLTADENQILCRVGPATPMGELMRRYWQPALLSSDLPHPDCAPKRLRLLGQDFVAFRGTDGRVGVLNEGCCHRGASLVLGRVEGGGIRCIFHGWKFAADGTILETPNAADSKLKENYKAKAYPAREAGDMIWVYLGPPDKQPPFRQFAYMNMPDGHRIVIRRNMDCNYLQVMEGGLDSSHVGILHADLAQRVDLNSDKIRTAFGDQSHVVSAAQTDIEVRDTDFGFDYAALRIEGNGRDKYSARITPFIMPNLTIVPPGTFSNMYIPYDDTHTGWIVTFWDDSKRIDRDAVLKVAGLNCPGAWVNDKLMLSRENNFMQDRQAMANGSWSGIDGVSLEDAAVQLSMGPIHDRTQEHLVPADRAIIRARRMLLDNVRRVQNGQDPIGLRPSDTLKIRAREGRVARKDQWQELVPGHRAIDTPAQSANIEG
jgi:nitrite reductase/ring-hydroxylating ferredoxin subunit